MAEESFQEKTEQPTPKRIREAREKGQVAKSMELSSVAIMLAGIGALVAMGPYTAGQLKGTFSWLFESSSYRLVNPEAISGFVTQIVYVFGRAIAPIAVALVAVALGISFLQVGPLVSTQAIEPKFEKLDVTKGLKRLFSVRSLFSASRDVVKLAIITLICWYAIKAELPTMLRFPDMEVQEIASAMGAIAIKISLKILIALIVIAVLDYAYQKYDYIKGLKMSKQELKEEMKTTEGNPQVKSRIRTIQREMSRKRMMTEVPKADVVVTNPTHIAVALKYDTEKMDAPVVLAKGQRLIAEAIKQIAKEAGVPIVENKPLARALFKTVEIGMQIPADLYKGVAEVLAYVYSLKDKGGSRS